ncbi:competence protein ComEA [Enterococcus sp. DIV2402]|uniref:Competence protein ComEA n=1 Tax=Candidatus Enterococcus lowellii TaxID=2230877 RepID=A0ABZ2SSX6_9ENTE|nr:helix-hairpin-helix domain-containing protein [Enterococcus sp. DIV2402]MBO0463696.1 helix-hairpin-helix domain-containing protein [Enterococcus sp. DIV2402]
MSRVEKYKKYLPVFVVIIVAISVIYIFVPKKATVSDWEELPMEQSETPPVEITSSSSSAKMVIDIKGEVKKPGVYELEPGARVEEIVLLAGGFTDKAEERQLNLAEKLTDQQMIYVPNKEEAKELSIPSVTNEGNTSKESSLVNINTADLTELQTLTGIGPAKAQAIIDYRDENGQFKTIEELKEVNGFGEKTVEKLKESITI